MGLDGGSGGGLVIILIFCLFPFLSFNRESRPISKRNGLTEIGSVSVDLLFCRFF